MSLPCDLKVAVVGAEIVRCQINKFPEMIARPDNNLHPGNAELAIVLVDRGSEALDQRSGHIPHSATIRLGEHFSEASFNSVDLPDIEFSMSRPGNETRDDDHLRDEIDQGSVRFTIAQTLKCDPCAQRELCGFPAGHGEKERPFTCTRGGPTRGSIFFAGHVRQLANGFRVWILGLFATTQERTCQNLSLYRRSSPIVGRPAMITLQLLRRKAKEMRLTVLASSVRTAPRGGIRMSAPSVLACKSRGAGQTGHVAACTWL